MKDIQVQYMTFCDYAMTSQENKLSIIGIFDEVRVAQFPGGLASAALVTIVKGKPDTTYVLTISGDKGKKNIFQPVDITVRTSPSGISNITINLNHIGFQEAGEYVFSVKHAGKEIGSTILKVNQAQQQNEMKYTLPN